MAVPETLIRNRLVTILTNEFGGDGLKVYSDKLTRALGDDGHYAGVSPNSSQEATNDVLTLNMEFLVQVYRRYDPQIDYKQRVDPTTIESWADRFRVACKTQDDINQPEAWYFRIVRIDFPDDPTGNKTRFVATIRCFGNNTSQL